MKNCPNCQTELADASLFCPQCGHKTTTESQQSLFTTDDGDDLDFVVTEAQEDMRELVGGVDSHNDEDDLKIRSSADLMEDEARRAPEESLETDRSDIFEHTPIGDSSPPLPPARDYSSEAEELGGESHPFTAPDDGSASRVEKLSDDQVDSIKKNLYGSSEQFLSEKDRQNLLSDIDNSSEATNERQPDRPAAFDNTPIVPPKKSGKTEGLPVLPKDSPAPKMATRVKGIVYFGKNEIRIPNGPELREHDELTINGRAYTLRKRKANNKFLVRVVAPVVALLIFGAGAYFTSDATRGNGQIVGIVLGLNQQPLLQRATVRLPESGSSYHTDSQGFFKTDVLRAGSHRMELVVKGTVFATDYATVVDDKITTVTLRVMGDQTEPVVNAAAPTSPETENTSVSTPWPESPDSPGQQTRTAAKNPNLSSKTAEKAATRAPLAKIKLTANVKGARLSIDGSVVGAGNLTYTELKPGERTYTVSADGYRTAKGSIMLRSGEISDLRVTLEPLATSARQETQQVDEYYQSGEAAFLAENYDGAVSELSEAINLKPDYIAAYHLRAQSHEKLGQNQAAHADYLRTAELYSVTGESNWAITAFNHAVSLDPESVPALLGRASLYLAKGEEIPAIADYETVVRIDRRNAEAYNGLGEARYNQGYYKKAIKHFKDAKSLEPTNPRPYQYLMLCYLATDDLKKVYKTFEKYSEVASQEDLDRLYSDNRYAAVVQAIENKE